MFIAFVVGMFLSLDFRFNNVVRALILVPWMFSLVDVSLEWKWMLDPGVGLYNWVLTRLGLISQGIPWVGIPDLAMFTIILVMAWYFSPFMALLVVASLNGVPSELYEASALDGAHKMARFRYITWNSLKYPILIGGLLTAAWYGNSLDVVFVLTAGGPNNATMILPYYMFLNVFYYLNLAYGSAIALINFAILACVAGVFLFVFRRYWRGE
jgi:multiple sugar transport system permease protein